MTPRRIRSVTVGAEVARRAPRSIRSAKAGAGGAR
jgi:hypothetical protein